MCDMLYVYSLVEWPPLVVHIQSQSADVFEPWPALHSFLHSSLLGMDSKAFYTLTKLE